MSVCCVPAGVNLVYDGGRTLVTTLPSVLMDRQPSSTGATKPGVATETVEVCCYKKTQIN